MDVQYFASNGGAKINTTERENTVKIILSGNGGTTVYTLNITNTNVCQMPVLAWILICVGIPAVGAVAVILILKLGGGSAKPKAAEATADAVGLFF